MNQDAELNLQQSWQERQEFAEQMVPMIGKLYREQAVEVLVYGNSLLNASVIDIIKSHRRVRLFEGEKLPLRESFPIVQSLVQRGLAPAVIDVGQLAIQFRQHNGDLDGFLDQQLGQLSDSPVNQARDVVLYGFGRIGRLMARLLIEKQSKNTQLRLRAIVVRGGKDGDLEKRASLLRRDSVHGPFNGSITIDHERNALKANGNFIQVIYADDPSTVDYTKYGIHDALLCDNTGKWRDEDGLGLHLKAKGIGKVVLTAPGKGNIKNIVYGVNDGDIESADKLLSAASCTTNAITPVLKAIDEQFSILDGHVETVHSYTNDQNLIDNYHKADRRGRSAPLNMVITETGAAKAVAKAYPKLNGKLTGNAIRVPTPNVSMAILSLNLATATDKETVNDYLKQTSLFSTLADQIDYTASTEIVSTDMVGSRAASVVDSQATIVSGSRVTLYVWYDNEFGYSCQVMRVLAKMADATIAKVPA